MAAEGKKRQMFATTVVAMSSRVCWKCDSKTHMTLLSGSVQAYPTDNSTRLMRVQGAFICDECKFMSIGMTLLDTNGNVRSIEEYINSSPKNLVWLPNTGLEQDFPDVPEHIAEAASEACRVDSIGAHRAAILLARSVVEATAKEKGVTKGLLYDKIEQLHAQRLIRDHIKDAAHEIRFLGNNMAHGDFVEPISPEEAEEVLGLMSQILNEVFQAPAQVEKRKQARLAKEAQSKAEAE